MERLDATERAALMSTAAADEPVLVDESTLVLNAEHEGLRVFVLLNDNRILMSRELGDKHCAEIHAKQVMDLKLTPVFLVNVLGFQVAEGV